MTLGSSGDGGVHDGEGGGGPVQMWVLHQV